MSTDLALFCAGAIGLLGIAAGCRLSAVELALRELDRIGFSFESGILRQSALQLPYMGIFSHITKMQCKSTSMVVPLTISVQYDDWKSSTERTLRVPECCYRAVFFTLDHVSLSCFTAVASHHFVVTRR